MRTMQPGAADAVVLDIGSCTARAGYAGEAAPAVEVLAGGRRACTAPRCAAPSGRPVRASSWRCRTSSRPIPGSAASSRTRSAASPRSRPSTPPPVWWACPRPACWTPTAGGTTSSRRTRSCCPDVRPRQRGGAVHEREALLGALAGLQLARADGHGRLAQIVVLARVAPLLEREPEVLVRVVEDAEMELERDALREAARAHGELLAPLGRAAVARGGPP